MTSRRDLEQQVEARAVGRCEYCRMHQSFAALALNHPRRLQIRQAEELFDLFPPTEGR